MMLASQTPTLPAPPMPVSPITFGTGLTLWSGDGMDSAWALADDLVLALSPGWVQLHTTEPGPVAEQVHRALPNTKLAVGLGVDGVAKRVALGERSVDWGVKTLVDWSGRAFNAGAVVTCYNAESRWKTPPNSDQRTRLTAVISQTLDTVAQRWPTMELWHTSFDHPTLHGTYPWRPWVGPGTKIRKSFPQVYGAPGDGLMAHAGALPRREAAALASWAAAVRQGLIAPDAPDGTVADLADVDWCPYYQLHSVPAADTLNSALRHPLVAAWAGPTRWDRDGRTALVALLLLERLGLRREGGVRAFQQMYPAAGMPDGIYGPKTQRELLRVCNVRPEQVGLTP